MNRSQTSKTIKPLLEIKNLTIKSIHNNNKLPDDHNINKIILENLNLTIYPGEIHVIMGPNGAGKSTLANVLVKHPDYVVTAGSITYLTQNLSDLTPDSCAQQGMFLSFQNPVAIPGVSNIQFLKASLNAIRKARGDKPLDAIDFVNIAKEKIKMLNMPEEFLYRSINEDFSGGEKKRNEILQMMLLEPKLAILDEIDSGLDIDSLKIVAQGIKTAKKKDTAILLITHYQRILKYIEPNFVHILTNKKISMSGDKKLVKKLEAEGYTWLTSANG